VLGSAFIGEELAKRVVGVWMKTAFAGGRHARRLRQISRIEKELKGTKP
jgi:ribose 5-phosphate isomerase B